MEPNQYELTAEDRSIRQFNSLDLLVSEIIEQGFFYSQGVEPEFHNMSFTCITNPFLKDKAFSFQPLPDVNVVMTSTFPDIDVVLQRKVKDYRGTELDCYFHAVLSGNEEVLRHLIEKAKSPLPKEDLMSYLQLAISRPNEKVFQVLWQKAGDEKRAANLGQRRRALHVAAKRGCVQIMNNIVRSNPEQLNVEDLNGDTPAVCAIKSGNPKALQYLLDRNADFTKGKSALGYAVLVGDIESVNVLIKHQQKIGGNLKTIAADALHESIFLVAVKNNVKSILDLLLQTVNKAPNRQEYSSQHTALSLAYKRKRYDMMTSLVNSSLMESEPKDEKGELLLMRAYHDKDIEAFKVLTISPRLNFDFIVNKDNGDWFLHQLIQDYATLLLAESKDNKVIELQEEFLVALLKTNVKIENINKHQQSAMQKALSLGIQQEYKVLIEKLPKSPGVSDSDNSGRSSPDIAREGSPKLERQVVENINPLTIAAYLNNSNMVTELLAVGYDAKVKDALGNSVLSVAITNKNLTIAVALLAKGAVFKDDKEKEKFLKQVIKKDLNGLTALGRAIKLRDDRKIKLLAQYSGDTYDELLRAVNANNESLATTLLGAVGRDNVINCFDDSYDKQDDNLTQYLFSKSDLVVQHLKDKLDWSKLKKLKENGVFDNKHEFSKLLEFKELIFDEKYWRAKATLSDCPAGVKEMRSAFQEAKSEAELFTSLHNIAQRKYGSETSRGNMMYLFFAYDKRDGQTWNLYNALRTAENFEDLLDGKKGNVAFTLYMKNLLDDVEEVRSQKVEEPAVVDHRHSINTFPTW